MKPFYVIVLCALLLFSLSACSKADRLTGTAWQLTAIGDTPVLEGSTITATFEDGNVGGSAGCNSYGGSFTLEGSKLAFSPLFSTKMACMEPEGVMDQEFNYLEWLGAAEKYTLKGGELLISRADGRALTFEPQK